MTRRARGTGRIYLPKGSSIYWLQYYQNGVKHRESSETSDRKAALEQMKLRIAEVVTGKATGLSPKKTKISELAEDFLRDYRINGKSSLTMIHCKELNDKVVRLVTIYEDGMYGPEVHIEFTDGTTFSACLKNQVSIEAKYIHDQGGEPKILRDYSCPAVSR